MKNYFTLFIFSIFILVSCSPIDHSDYSNDSRFSSLIGKSLVTRIETDSLGVTLGSLREKKIDYYYIYPKPNFSGPEVISRTIIPAGTRFKITGVYATDYVVSNKDFYLKVVSVEVDGLSESFYLIEFNDAELENNAGLDSKVFHFD